MLLSDKYPFLTKYFKQGIDNKLNNKGVPIAHSLLFYGSNLNAQYILAKEIARLLNCTGDHSDDCQCLNCQWISQDRHPAVLTVSKVDNKPSDDDSKTVISIKQANMIKSSLVTNSEFFRVFIFCDRDEEGNIKGLNPQNFQDETANSLLKAIEEPNDRIMFIFLTVNKEDVISTIISRSQCFGVSCGVIDEIEFPYSLISDTFEKYWEFERGDVFDVAKTLFELSKENSAKDVLNSIQNYILSVIKSNPNNTNLISDITAVERAKKQVALGMSAQSVFENMCLALIK